MLSFYLEGFHVWIVDYDVWVAVKSQNFCLRVSKSPRHRQPTGQDSQRPSKIELLILVHLFFLVGNDLIGGRPVVYLSSSLFDPLGLAILARFVIEAERISASAFLA